MYVRSYLDSFRNSIENNPSSAGGVLSTLPDSSIETYGEEEKCRRDDLDKAILDLDSHTNL